MYYLFGVVLLIFCAPLSHVGLQVKKTLSVYGGSKSKFTLYTRSGKYRPRQLSQRHCNFEDDLPPETTGNVIAKTGSNYVSGTPTARVLIKLHTPTKTSIVLLPGGSRFVIGILNSRDLSARMQHCTNYYT